MGNTAMKIFVFLMVNLAVVPNGAGEIVTVTGDHVNVRAAASPKSEVLVQLNQGDHVELAEPLPDATTAETAVFVRIHMPASVRVWVHKTALDAAGTTVVKTDVRVRAGPGTSYTVVGKFNKGEAVQPEQTQDDWVKLRPTTNCFAFTAAKYLQVGAAPAPKEEARRVEAPKVEPPKLEPPKVEPTQPTPMPTAQAGPQTAHVETPSVPSAVAPASPRDSISKPQASTAVTPTTKSPASPKTPPPQVVAPSTSSTRTDHDGIMNQLKSTWPQARVLAISNLANLGEIAVQPLIGCLKDQDLRVRSCAAEALGKLADDRAVEPLIACLKDKDSVLRDQAIEALSKLGKPADEQLIAFLKGQDSGAVRSCAAEALGKLADEHAVEPLIACLKDQDSRVRWRAAKALQELHYVPANENDSIPYLIALQSWGELAKIGRPAVEPLITCLKGSNPYVRSPAAEALGNIGDARSVEPLIACLKDKDSILRMTGAEALGKLGKPAVDPLIACLKDQDSSVRRLAAEALGNIGDARSVEPLIACLKDQDSGVGSRAAKALGKLADKRAVEPLIAFLGGEDSVLREQATKALSKLGKPAVEPLIACLKDQDSGVRGLAAEALGNISDARSVEPLIACLGGKDSVLREQATEALSKLGKPAVEPLIACLKVQDSGVRSDAAKALGGLADARAVAPLIACLKDKDSILRMIGAEALGKLGDARATDSLVACLKDQSWLVREHAAEALGKLFYVPASESEKITYLIARNSWDELVKIGLPTIEPLITCLRDHGWSVGGGVDTVLRKLGKPAVEPLIAYLKDRDLEVRVYAARALGDLGDARAVEPLTTCLNDQSSYVRIHVAEALGELRYLPANENEKITYLIALYAWGELAKIGQPAVKPLIACLKDRNSDVRKHAAEALGSIGDRRAVASLLLALPDRDANQKIGSALGKLGWKPRSDTERVYLWICEGNNENLKTHWQLTKRVLLADVKSGNRRKIENAVRTFAPLDKPEITAELVRILESKGNQEMARVFHDSGNADLREAGESWAKRRGLLGFPGVLTSK